MSLTLQNGTVIERLANGSRVVLPDGTVVHGHPHNTENYRETAKRLGYDDDVVALARDHDPMHAWLCAALGLPDSPALRLAIGLEADPLVAALEEQAVMSLQSFCRRLGIDLFGEEDSLCKS